MSDNQNENSLIRVYFNTKAQHYVMMRENLWNSFDSMPKYMTWFMEKVYCGTEAECIEFLRMQKDPPEHCE
jgi:hypothetical protein